ncbi:DEAD/DEAH box helicase, partial [Aquimarina celericrescens]|nr:DEAD/DEAH box helicase [Aquimarina celericrescens]
LMAPPEILAPQHYEGLSELCEPIGVEVELLTGSTKKKDRKILHERLRNGELHILIGTHALIEDTVQFKNLGLAVIDEQHRFGVAQRAKL